MAQLRGYYLWNGGSPHDVDDIQYADAVMMWKLYQAGMVGPMTAYLPAYNNYAMIHHSTGSKKRPEKIQRVFDTQMKIMQLKDPSHSMSVSEKAALSLGMPSHIRKRLIGA